MCTATGYSTLTRLSREKPGGSYVKVFASLAAGYVDLVILANPLASAYIVQVP